MKKLSTGKKIILLIVSVLFSCAVVVFVIYSTITLEFSRRFKDNVMDGAWDPVWSPSGDKIAFTCVYLTPEQYNLGDTAWDFKWWYLVSPDICVKDLQSGEVQVLDEGQYATGGFTWSPDGTKLAWHWYKNEKVGINIWDSITGENIYIDLALSLYTYHGDLQWLDSGDQILFQNNECGSICGHMFINIEDQSYSDFVMQDNFIYCLNWSPDGSSMAIVDEIYDKESEIFSCDLSINRDDQLIWSKELPSIRCPIHWTSDSQIAFGLATFTEKELEDLDEDDYGLLFINTSTGESDKLIGIYGNLAMSQDNGFIVVERYNVITIYFLEFFYDPFTVVITDEKILDVQFHDSVIGNQLSADGSLLAVETDSWGGDIWIVDLDDGSVVNILD